MTADSARYHITETDYLRAGALYGRPNARGWALLGVVLASCLVLAIWGPTRALRAGGLGGIMGGVAVGLLIHYVVSPWILRRHYRRYKAVQDEQTVTLTDEGVRFEGAGGVSDLRWSRVYRWRSNNDYVLIYLMPRLYHLVPRRVADQGFDIAALEAALARHVGLAR